jgi:hypothetical protein
MTVNRGSFCNAPVRGVFAAAAIRLLACMAISTAACAPALAASGPPIWRGKTRPLTARAVRVGSLPLCFERNVGQADARVSLIGRSAGGAVFLTPTEAVLVRPRRPRTVREPGQNSSDLRRRTPDTSVLRMHLVGANARARPSAESLLPSTVNYFIGADPRRWRTHVATYRRARFHGIYPGVDLVYYGDGSRLEYDFDVASGADPGAIGLAFPGAKRVKLRRDGSLEVALRDGAARWLKPVCYQEIAGKRKPVRGRYVRNGRGGIGFALARYDRRRPLVIDPVLVFSTLLGGSGTDVGRGIAVDATGIYVVGETTSANFPVTPGAPQSAYNGAQDVFVAKLDPSGESLLYATYLGGTIYQDAGGIAVRDGLAYITGVTGPGFPVTPNAYRTDNSSSNAYVTKLARDGASLLYSTFVPGNGDNFGTGIAVDKAANAYISGFTSSTDFPIRGGFQTAIKPFPPPDAFLVRLDTTRSGDASLIYSTYVGGSTSDYGNAIAIDGTGVAYMTGKTYSPDFPVRNAYQGTQNASSGEAFLVAIDTNRSGDASLLYSTCLGGTGYEDGRAIAVDSAGGVYITGQTASPDLLVRNGFQRGYGGNKDAFVAKFNTHLTGDASLIYSTYLGDAGEEEGRGLAVDGWGDAYVAGYTSDAALHNHDAFLAKLSADGSTLRSIAILGGTSDDYGYAAALDVAGACYVTGQTASVDFPTTAGAFQAANGGGASDSFILELPATANIDDRPNTPGILFQNASTGELAAWQMSGPNLVRYRYLTPSVPGPPEWRVAASADFDRDGQPDLLFQNESSGQLVYWLMDGLSLRQVGFIEPSDPGAAEWKVVGAADLNGDGRPDLLFQNQRTSALVYWLMDGTSMTAVGFISPSDPGGPDWAVVATPDFNGDGQADLLFQNRTTGRLAYWLMRGTKQIEVGLIDPATPGPPEWRVVGSADLNGDGNPDLLFQNQANGKLVYWLMNGTALLQFGYLNPATPGDLPWQVAAPF